MLNKTLLILSFLCMSNYAKCQLLSVEDNWLAVLDSVSIGWKNDSLTNTNYRYDVRSRLLECSFSDLTESVLFKYLGNPNEIQNQEVNDVKTDYVSYRYYFWTDPNSSYRRLYISFVFDKQGKFLFLGKNLICGN